MFDWSSLMLRLTGMFNWSSLMFRLIGMLCLTGVPWCLDWLTGHAMFTRSYLMFRLTVLPYLTLCLDWLTYFYSKILDAWTDRHKTAAYNLYLKLPDVQTDRHTVHIPRRWTWNIKDKVLQRDWNVFQKMAKFCVKAPFFGTSSHLVVKMLKIWLSFPLSKRITHSNDRVWYRVSHIPCLIG